ncbi:hypothetical protein PLANTIT3_60147 [Plantibacter sp. T3]|nr:hypothetical protein PLANTIT3_60147 [Plantibacter sp. T3]
MAQTPGDDTESHSRRSSEDTDEAMRRGYAGRPCLAQPSRRELSFDGGIYRSATQRPRQHPAATHPISRDVVENDSVIGPDECLPSLREGCGE